MVNEQAAFSSWPMSMILMCTVLIRLLHLAGPYDLVANPWKHVVAFCRFALVTLLDNWVRTIKQTM